MYSRTAASELEIYGGFDIMHVLIVQTTFTQQIFSIATKGSVARCSSG